MIALLRRNRPKQVTAATESSPPPPLDFRSRALTLLLENTPKDRRWQVLDLGPPNQTNLNFFAHHGANYAIEDLSRNLEPCRRGNDYDQGKIECLPSLLKFPSDMTFDLILAWDLFNFLPRSALTPVAQRLAPHCHERSQLYALLSMESNVPQNPGRAEVLDDKTIQLDGWEASRSRPSPHHTAAVLAEAMAPFGVNKTYLLKLQMHEYLLELTSDDSHSNEASLSNNEASITGR